LHLRQGVRFHDGTTFDAEAVKWNLEMQKNGVKSDLKGVYSIEVVGPYVVRLSLSQDDPLFVQRLCSSMAGKMTSPAAYELYGPQDVRLHPVGTGPFRFVSYEPDAFLKYERFDDYWQKGLPYLDGVTIEIVSESTVRKMAFLGGEGQILYGASPTDASELEAAGATMANRVAVLFTLAGDSRNLRSPTSDIRVRQAITYALDIPTIVNGVYGGFSPPTNQLAIEDGPGYDPDIKGYAYDPVKAAGLLAEVGITPQAPWKVDLFYQKSDDRDSVYTLVKAYLGRVGIEVNLRPLSFAAMKAKNEQGWNGLAAFSMSYNVATAYSSMLQVFFSEDAYLGGQYLYIPDEWNAKYRAMLLEADIEARNRAYQELNRMAIDDYCLLTPMFGLGGSIAIAADLHDSGFCVYCANEFLPETAWLSDAPR
jgi:peptide/nickel transport system substrate-binding protein